MRLSGLLIYWEGIDVQVPGDINDPSYPDMDFGYDRYIPATV